MRHAARLTLAVAVWLLAAGGTRAQQLSPTNVFTFAPAPSDLTEVPDADDITTKLKARAELKVRPNAATELYLWVLNPTPNKDRFVVEVKGAGGALAVRTAEVTIPANTWVRVRVPKPAAPAAPATPPVVVVPPPGAAPPQPAPPPEPPPPGLLLAPVKGERKLSLRLLDKA